MVDAHVGHVVRVHAIVGVVVGAEILTGHAVIHRHAEDTGGIGREQHLAVLAIGDDLGDAHVGEHLFVVYDLMRLLPVGHDACVLCADEQGVVWRAIVEGVHIDRHMLHPLQWCEVDHSAAHRGSVHPSLGAHVECRVADGGYGREGHVAHVMAECQLVPLERAHIVAEGLLAHEQPYVALLIDGRCSTARDVCASIVDLGRIDELKLIVALHVAHELTCTGDDPQVVPERVIDEPARGVLGKLDPIDDERVAVHLGAVVAVDTLVGEAPYESSVGLLHGIHVARAEAVVQPHVLVHLPIGQGAHPHHPCEDPPSQLHRRWHVFLN